MARDVARRRGCSKLAWVDGNVYWGAVFWDVWKLFSAHRQRPELHHPACAEGCDLERDPNDCGGGYWYGRGAGCVGTDGRGVNSGDHRAAAWRDVASDGDRSGATDAATGDGYRSRAHDRGADDSDDRSWYTDCRDAFSCGDGVCHDGDVRRDAGANGHAVAGADGGEAGYVGDIWGNGDRVFADAKADRHAAGGDDRDADYTVADTDGDGHPDGHGNARIGATVRPSVRSTHCLWFGVVGEQGGESERGAWSIDAARPCLSP